MKRFKFYIAGLLTLFIFNSCSKQLDLLPQDEITNEQFWNTPSDLQLYANQFYTSFPVNSGYFVSPFWADINSDDMIPGTYNTRLAGQNTISTSNGSWSFNSIRNVNIGLANYTKVKGNLDQIKAGLGELKFFKAYYYYNLLKLYGDVPWLSKPLDTNSDELFNARTPRNIVVDSILNDLDTAIANLPLKARAEANRLNKECALLFKSRVALFEGSWEKYHAGTVFGVSNSNPTRYFEASAKAAEDLMNLASARLFQPADNTNYFGQLFGNTDLSGNAEILLWKKHDEALGMAHNIQGALYQGGDRGLSKSLVESFLCTDGLPISVSPNYRGDNTLTDIVANRDPRLAQSFWVPGVPFSYSASGAVTAYFTLPWIDRTGETRNTSGYQLVKGRTVNLQLGMNDHQTASIVFRYAECLLNFAEAKAELGTITQGDLDKSINLLRARVRMPSLVMASIVTDPKWMFPELSGIINEVRRERRVELAAEGYRFDDLLRWAAMKYIVDQRPKGYKFRQTDFPSLTIGSSIFVDANGYLDPYQRSLPNGFKFRLDRDYLLAVPQQEITLNSNLDQNPQWQ